MGNNDATPKTGIVLQLFQVEATAISLPTPLF